MKFLVLGGYGIIGRAVVDDLFKTCKDCEIVIAGRNLEKAEEYARSFNSKKVRAEKVDVNNIENISKVLKNSNVAVNCIQYYFNLNVMKACLKARTNYVDLGGLFHMTKEQLKLDKKFKKIGKTAILGIGAEPGISNILVAYGSKLLKRIESVEITFGYNDYIDHEQKFILPYSFMTIIDEFTQKPAVFRNGKLTFVEPFSGEKQYDFNYNFGKQNIFYTLHSELLTLPNYLKDKGIKNFEFRANFPKDFVEKIKILIDVGFVSKEEIQTNAHKIKIIEGTSTIMSRLVLKEDEKIKDEDILRVDFNKGRLKLDVITESEGEISGGTLDTGSPCSIAAQMIANRKIKEVGVFPPENIINPEEFLTELQKRKMKIMKNGKEVKL